MIFYAPNVHVGGGFELLKSLLTSINGKDIIFFLDSRISDKIDTSGFSYVFFVKPNVQSRLHAELKLKEISRYDTKIFCFHGLPPILAKSENITVFLQNRLYINSFSGQGYGIKISIRLFFERLVFKKFFFKVREFIVQSRSMQRDLECWLGKDSHQVTVFPFIASECKVGAYRYDKKYDFIYVADDGKHKNHVALINAWEQLAINGHAVTLALTLPINSKLLSIIDIFNKKYGNLIINLGILSKDAVSQAYNESRALIYPSLVESFGMPLIEAQYFGIPILAGELDYVRDVAHPDETFNPCSSFSIYLAVLRFLGKADELIEVKKPVDFLNYLVK